MADTPPVIGSLEVVLYAGLRGKDPIEVGTIGVPLTLKTVAGEQALEAHLGQALDYVREDVAAVFRGDHRG